jgi:hypothetical protein
VLDGFGLRHPSPPTEKKESKDTAIANEKKKS